MSEKPATSRRAPIRVLLVEDHVPDAHLIGLHLEQALAPGFRLTHVQKLADALARLEEAAFDVILLDLTLPDAWRLDGLARITGRTPHVPVVILTGTDDEKLARRAVRAGAQDYLVKDGLTPRSLMRVLHYAVERQALLKVQQNYLRIVAHDIRSPLTVIHMATQLALADSTVQAHRRLRETLETIRQHVDQLRGLADDFLDLEQVHDEGVRLRRRAIDLRALIGDTIAAHGLLAAGKGVGLVAGPQDPPLLVPADPRRLRQVLDNLLGNALRHTPTGGSVVLEARTDGDQAVVTVKDNGEGMPADMAEHLFDEYERARRGHSGHRIAGGLGLVICKKVIDAHGGTIGVRSKLGEGTEFRFTLPATTSPTFVVLVVDDDEAVLGFLAEYFRKHTAADFEVHCAGSFEQADEKLHETRPDLLLTDIRLPDGSGLDVLSVAQRASPGCLAIAITGFKDPEVQAKAARHGAAQLLTKPVSVETLDSLVEHLLGQTSPVAEVPPAEASGP